MAASVSCWRGSHAQTQILISSLIPELVLGNAGCTWLLWGGQLTVSPLVTSSSIRLPCSQGSWELALHAVGTAAPVSPSLLIVSGSPFPDWELPKNRGCNLFES